MTTIVKDRSTKYTVRVREVLEQYGHATNAQILDELRRDFPALSATTVHRITTRMCERDELRLAPVARDMSMRYDTNTSPHDHFMCNKCDRLMDAVFSGDVRRSIESYIADGCEISGSLTVSGVCKQCKEV